MSKALYTGIILSIDFIFRIFTVTYASVPTATVQTPNHPPHIKFIEPSLKTFHTWNEQVPYSVEISDQEDGESRFQEIPSAEVLVKLKYVDNQAKASLYVKQKIFADSAGVYSMLVSNCFNCHAVKIKLAGPSYLDISNRYQNTRKNQDLLINHIQFGSRGIWGKEAMPTHPELPDSAARKMVRWILNYAKDPGLNYIVGLQGTLPLIKPEATTHQGFFIIEAFYTDHGSSDQPDKKLTGSARMIIQMK
jgi:cytochrome c